MTAQVVDHFVRATQAQIAQLLQQYDALIANNHELRQALDEANARATQADFSGLGGRVQELLQIAEEQATDITRRAVQEADRLSAQVQCRDRRTTPEPRQRNWPSCGTLSWPSWTLCDSAVSKMRCSCGSAHGRG